MLMAPCSSQASLTSAVAARMSLLMCGTGPWATGQKDTLLLLGSCAHTGSLKTLHCGFLATSQLEKASWRRKSGGLTRETQCKNMLKIQVLTIRTLLFWGIWSWHLLLLLWLRAIKDLEPTWKPLRPKESSAFLKGKILPQTWARKSEIQCHLSEYTYIK